MDYWNPIMEMPKDPISNLIDELTYRSYKYNRDSSPEISAKSWAMVFVNAEEMEKRYQEERNG